MPPTINAVGGELAAGTWRVTVLTGTGSTSSAVMTEARSACPNAAPPPHAWSCKHRSWPGKPWSSGAAGASDDTQGACSKWCPADGGCDTRCGMPTAEPRTATTATVSSVATTRYRAGPGFAPR